MLSAMDEMAEALWGLLVSHVHPSSLTVLAMMTAPSLVSFFSSPPHLPSVQARRR